MPDLDQLDAVATSARSGRRTITVGAATLALLTATVHDLPAQAVDDEESRVRRGISDLPRRQHVRARRAIRNDEWVMIAVHPGAVAGRSVDRGEQRLRLALRAVLVGLLVRPPRRRLDPGYGTAIHVIAEGSSSSPSIDGGLGQHVVVEHTIDGKKVQSVYGHLVFGSQTVTVGDKVAWARCSERSAAPAPAPDRTCTSRSVPTAERPSSRSAGSPRT